MDQKKTAFIHISDVCVICVMEEAKLRYKAQMSCKDK